MDGLLGGTVASWTECGKMLLGLENHKSVKQSCLFIHPKCTLFGSTSYFVRATLNI